MTTWPLPAPSKCKYRLPQITGTCPGWWKQSFWYGCGLSCGFKWGPNYATPHVWSRLKKATPKCTWMCWRVRWSPVAIRWPVADLRFDSRTRCRLTSQKRPRRGFRTSAPTKYPSLIATPPPTLSRWTTSFGWEHHQHDLPKNQSQPDRRHPPSIRPALAGACGKGMLPIPDPYGGSDCGWRRLHWIDVSSTT